MNFIRKYTKTVLVSVLCLTTVFSSAVSAAENPDITPEIRYNMEIQSNSWENWPLGPQVYAESAIVMEASTGTILYSKNIDQQMYPASITKIMTMLLALEHLDLSEEVTFSHNAVYSIEYDSSHIARDEGEILTVEECLYAIMLESANECSNAIAEQVSGSTEAFAELMNQRAEELRMDNTHFEDCCGLSDSDEHYTTARDVAIMSRELVTKHPEIYNYTKIWMEDIVHVTRQGSSTFTLSSTNKLLRQYEWATGLKTGSTSKAKYCLSATASKDGIDLIAVVMGAPDNKVRFQDAMALLNYGFSVSNIYVDENKESLPVQRIKGGVEDTVNLSFAGEFRYLDTKGSNLSQIEKTISLPEEIEAPVEEGQPIGEAVYKLDGQRIGGVSIVAARAVEKAGYKDYVLKVIYDFLL